MTIDDPNICKTESFSPNEKPMKLNNQYKKKRFTWIIANEKILIFLDFPENAKTDCFCKGVNLFSEGELLVILRSPVNKNRGWVRQK